MHLQAVAGAGWVRRTTCRLLCSANTGCPLSVPTLLLSWNRPSPIAPNQRTPLKHISTGRRKWYEVWNERRLAACPFGRYHHFNPDRVTITNSPSGRINQRSELRSYLHAVTTTLMLESGAASHMGLGRDRPNHPFVIRMALTADHKTHSTRQLEREADGCARGIPSAP